MNRSTIPYSIVEERRRLNKCIENAPNEWEREIYKKIRDMKIPYDKLDTILETSKELIKKILESGYETESEEELNSQHDDDSLLDIFWDQADNRYTAPEEFCPICQFIEYSQHDLGKYLEKEYKVSRSDVFAKVKAVNKRRKKLYDSEYVTEVCKQFDLNPVDVVAGLKKRFVTYRAFSDYIRR